MGGVPVLRGGAPEFTRYGIGDDPAGWHAWRVGTKQCAGEVLADEVRAVEVRTGEVRDGC